MHPQMVTSPLSCTSHFWLAFPLWNFPLLAVLHAISCTIIDSLPLLLCGAPIPKLYPTHYCLLILSPLFSSKLANRSVFLVSLLFLPSHTQFMLTAFLWELTHSTHLCHPWVYSWLCAAERMYLFSLRKLFLLGGGKQNRYLTEDLKDSCSQEIANK
jgi:hypothetical protein